VGILDLQKAGQKNLSEEHSFLEDWRGMKIPSLVWWRN
jgi:hypothetical protein